MDVEFKFSNIWLEMHNQQYQSLINIVKGTSLFLVKSEATNVLNIYI